MQVLALHYQLGQPKGRVPEVLAAAAGIHLAQRALTEAAIALTAGGGVVHAASM